MLYQAKTGTPVYVPLPPHVVKALENVPPGPKPNRDIFSWSGNGQPKSVVADWQRSYRRLFKLVTSPADALSDEHRSCRDAALPALAPALRRGLQS